MACGGNLAGCATTTEQRLDADQEAYASIAERNGDPRWAAENVNIDMDPRSRYFDPYDPDFSPMPADDPNSQRYMRRVDGKRGWKHWQDNGVRPELENPLWRAKLSEYAELTEDGAVKLNKDSALRLAYVHSPQHQRTLETLYLSALDVTGERFRLDTQFFGGHSKAFDSAGKLNPASIAFIPSAGRYLVTRPFDSVGSNRLDVTSDIGARRNLATAGQILASFANSFVFEFNGSNVNLASSLANFSFIQPLLRGAGRDIALEQLTLDERLLLSNLRAYGQFRQGFFTQVVIGELGVTGPTRGFSSTTLQSFSGFGGVNGYLGLLQQAQQIRNTEDNLRLQLRTRDRLEALYDNELIDIVQVDQFRQNIEVTRANLLDQQNNLKLAVDNYKTDILGLPADLPIKVDEELVQGFQLIPTEANPILESLLQLQSRIGEVGELSNLDSRIDSQQQLLDTIAQQDIDNADRTIRRLQGLVKSVGRRLRTLPQDVEDIGSEGKLPGSLSENESAALDLIIARSADNEKLQQRFQAAAIKLEELSVNLTDANLQQTVNENSAWLQETLSLCRGVVLVQSIVREISSEPEQVFDRAEELVPSVQKLFADARTDLKQMDDITAEREKAMRDDEKTVFQRDRERLHQRMDDLENGTLGFQVAVKQLNELRAGYTQDTRTKTIRGLTAWIQNYLQITERLTLVPAQARLEVITVENVELDPDDAFQIALAHRLDFMNGRAALVDRWRAIQVAADALQADLTVTGGGDIRTAKNNPVNFRAPTSNFRLGLEFDAPLARLLERNGYRETLIEFQRNRRNLIQSRDNLQKGLRALLRTLEQRRLQLEIQRRAVSIALRRVDQTQLALLTPPPPGQPGVRPQINPTTAINLLSAQGSLQSSQNSFLAAWLNYYAARLRLYRELGVMTLDPSGRWIENDIQMESTGDALPSDLQIQPSQPLDAEMDVRPGNAGLDQEMQLVPSEPLRLNPGVEVSGLSEEISQQP